MGSHRCLAPESTVCQGHSQRWAEEKRNGGCTKAGAGALHRGQAQGQGHVATCPIACCQKEGRRRVIPWFPVSMTGWPLWMAEGSLRGRGELSRAALGTLPEGDSSGNRVCSKSLLLDLVLGVEPRAPCTAGESTRQPNPGPFKVLLLSPLILRQELTEGILLFLYCVFRSTQLPGKLGGRSWGPQLPPHLEFLPGHINEDSPSCKGQKTLLYFCTLVTLEIKPRGPPSRQELASS